LKFLAILDILDAKQCTEIRFDDPMHGELDFSVLKDRGFDGVKSIVFDHPGEVLQLRNIPEGVTHLDCKEQLLIDLDGLPATIEEIEVTDNKIEKVNAKNLPKLKALRISNNKLTQLVSLPETLQILECDNNDLRRIDLAYCIHLKTLHCSNNALLILEHVPPSLEDFVMDNDVTIDNSTISAKKKEKKIDFIESINEYFKLKNDYETKLSKAKRSAYEKGGKGTKGLKKAREVRGICVKCKRKVGSIFQLKEQKYIALCGDKSKPCDLNIQIFNGDQYDLRELLDIYNNEVLDAKERIIRDKLDALFNYVSPGAAVGEFKEDLKNYDSSSKMYKLMYDDYVKIYDSPERKQQYSRKMEEMYRICGEIDKMMEEYKKTGMKEALTQAMNTYVKDYVPVIQSMRILKYVINNVEVTPGYSLLSDVSKLVQHEVAMFDRDYIYGEEPRVQKYQV
jgi:hypothetical protein